MTDKVRSRFDVTISGLERVLADPLPGHDAQLTMSPGTRRTPNTLHINGRQCREGSVLALLFPLEQQAGIVLTQRPHTLRDHAGQISFPGGRREDGESLEEAALRELEEELGITQETVRVLGALTPLYIPPSNFCVFPHVGMLDHRPTWKANPAEVEGVLEIPLDLLAAEATRRREVWTLRGDPVQVPFFEVGEARIWGATAMMLAELLEVYLKL